jgi:outer membrane protein assembly factor BamD (BamD/ComL family)
MVKIIPFILIFSLTGCMDKKEKVRSVSLGKDDLLFEEGMRLWKESHPVERDQKETRDALSKFRELINNFPTSPRVRDAKRMILACEEKLALKEYKVGYFYEKRKKYKAAKMQYQRVIENYSNTECAEEARIGIARCTLKSGALEEALLLYEEFVKNYPNFKKLEEVKAEIEKIKKELERRKK